MSWQVYIVKTTCGKLYTGISTDVERRFHEHQDMFRNKKGKGAKFFRIYEPNKIVYSQPHETRSSASKREYEIKQMSAQKKQKLIAE